LIINLYEEKNQETKLVIINQQALENLTKEKAELEGQIKDWKKRYQQLETLNQQLTEEKQNLEKEKSRLEQLIKEIKNKLGDDNINSLIDQLLAKKKELEELQKQNKQDQQKLKQVQEAFVNLKKQLNNKVSPQDIKNLLSGQQKISTLEAKIVELEKKLKIKSKPASQTQSTNVFSFVA